MEPSPCWAKAWLVTMFQTMEIDMLAAGPLFCLNTAAGTHWPAIRADWDDEEEVGAVERPFVPRYELVGEEDCFGDTGRWEGWRFPPAFAPLDGTYS